MLPLETHTYRLRQKMALTHPAHSTVSAKSASAKSAVIAMILRASTVADQPLRPALCTSIPSEATP
jgi:hypothetical protein